MKTILRAVIAATLLLGLSATPANAAAQNITCDVRVVGANVVPNRYTSAGVTFGTDAAVATISCVSLTGDEYLAWVDVEFRGYNGALLAPKDFGSPTKAVGGVAAAATPAQVAAYDEGSGAPILRTHTVIALGYVAPLCWPSCANELKGIVSYTYQA